MPVEKYAFTKGNVDKSPDAPGVYALYDNEELIYYGQSEVSIRERLQSHQSGDEGRCTQQATHYSREEHSDPVSREVVLLRTFKLQTGRLPRCNERG